jgi:RNA polymerase sigma factor (sigma-70 family)
VETEAQLVQQALTGDKAAVERLLLLYYDRILAFLTAKIPAKMASYLDPQDVLHDAYSKAFRALDDFEPNSEHSFYAWLKTIAHRQLLDKIRRFEKDALGATTLRRAPRPGGSGSTMIGVSQFLADDGPLPGEAANLQEMHGAMQVALAALEPHYQQAIRLRYLLNHSAEETADKMKISTEQLRGILFRARQKLKEEIGRLSLYI